MTPINNKKLAHAIYSNNGISTRSAVSHIVHKMHTGEGRPTRAFIARLALVQCSSKLLSRNSGFDIAHEERFTSRYFRQLYTQSRSPVSTGPSLPRSVSVAPQPSTSLVAGLTAAHVQEGCGPPTLTVPGRPARDRWETCFCTAALLCNDMPPSSFPDL